MNPSNVSPPNPGANQPNNPAGTSGAGDQIKDLAREKTRQLKQAAASTAQQAKDKAAQAVGEGREEVADRVGGYSSAVRDSARSFEEQDPNIAWLAHQAADRIQGVADYIRTRDFNGLRADAESFGRRHPAVLLGGLFLTGFLLGSALKAGRAATSQQEQSDFEYEYDPETSPGEAMTSPPVSSIPGSAEI